MVTAPPGSCRTVCRCCRSFPPELLHCIQVTHSWSPNSSDAQPNIVHRAAGAKNHSIFAHIWPRSTQIAGTAFRAVKTHLGKFALDWNDWYYVSKPVSLSPQKPKDEKLTSAVMKSNTPYVNYSIIWKLQRRPNRFLLARCCTNAERRK